VSKGLAKSIFKEYNDAMFRPLDTILRNKIAELELSDVANTAIPLEDLEMSDDYDFFDYPNRVMCSVLDEMRGLIKHAVKHERQKQLLLSMVEECQIMGNRMEASLSDAKDIKSLYKKRKELRNEVNKLKEEKAKLKSETNSELKSGSGDDSDE